MKSLSGKNAIKAHARRDAVGGKRRCAICRVGKQVAEAGRTAASSTRRNTRADDSFCASGMEREWTRGYVLKHALEEGAETRAYLPSPRARPCARHAPYLGGNLSAASANAQPKLGWLLKRFVPWCAIGFPRVSDKFPRDGEKRSHALWQSLWSLSDIC